MSTQDREDRGVLDRLDSALVMAIKGALWFPLVYIPRQIQGSFPLVVKVARVGGLFAVWLACVFGPASFLGEVNSPFVVMGILAWTVLALAGSAFGVWTLRKSARDTAGVEKPADLAEAFV